jgi:hypothetical protein
MFQPLFRRLMPFLLTCALAAGAVAQERNTLVIGESSPYQASAYPDRIVLVITEEPATSQTINWRTAASVIAPRVQIVMANASPGLHVAARTETATTTAVQGDNGVAHHHSLTFAGLMPATLYAYRVGGEGTWSEWFQFRTAGDVGEPFSFLYFGDAQNSVKSHFSRVLREANRELSRPALMLHAGDLVNQRSGNHDDEWGEWFDAGGFLHAMSPSFPVTGNHEFIEEPAADGSKHNVLPENWPAQFTVPANGPDGLRKTVYFSRYQGVLFVALDSTRALEDETLAIAQAQWLDALLAADDSNWVVVSHHHPLFSTSSGRDNPMLRKHWQPVYDRHGVALVLQGHDHGYGRGDNLASGSNGVTGPSGTVYVVSVAGPKMSRVSDLAQSSMRRTAEDTQLFQVIHVSRDRLRFESRTATGALYDAFTLVKAADGSQVLEDAVPENVPVRECSNQVPGDPSRCWAGTELVN